ncbi:MAG: molybdopterin molybdenumtransferase MoeA [Lysobacterales bacterium]|jgi:molybdopterin molybdotransferase|nr:MAG: molybdopterin molybdenumtransferase MoeA [Xanthomonadales bacterium]
MTAMLRLEAARERIIEAMTPVEGTESVLLDDALDRVLADPVHAAADVPPRANSAMDGYALAGRDLPAAGEVSLAIVGTSLAGRPWSGTVPPESCVRIMTGALLPAGSDTVVMQEQVRVEGDRAVFGTGHRPGQHVRPPGEDLRAGDLAVDTGTLLGPPQLGLLAALGVGRVTVRRRPRVAIFSTGDELRPVDAPLEPGQVHDSNRHALRALLARLAVEVRDLGIVPDTPEATREALEAAAAWADAIVTTGGVSVGDADHVTGALGRGGHVDFWKVAMKPGKPVAFGRYGRAAFFGLPGNPVSAIVTWCQLVRPALQRLTGATPEAPLTLRAVCLSRLGKSPGRLEFQRGVLERDPSGRWFVRSTGHQGSGVLRSMSSANAFIVLPLEQGDVEPGSEVDVQPFAGLW